MTAFAPPSGQVERGSWSSSAQFFITSLGAAVGVGNVWRFPNVAYNNGGAVFIIAYALCLIFLAVPVLLLEATLGQYSKKSAIGIWDMCPLFRGIGVATFFNAFVTVVYYNTPVSWGAYYLVNSFTNDLPWSKCREPWATEQCTTNMTLVYHSNSNTSNITYRGPAEEYFYRNTLQLTDDAEDWGPFVWETFLANCILWLMLFGGICLGPASLGRISYFTSLMPYVMFAVLIGYTATLDGAIKGVEYYIARPEWEKLGDIKVWRQAVTAVFYSTNCALGAVIQLASYNKFKHNVYRDAILIPILDGVTSIFAGFIVFTVLGHMAHIRNLNVDEVVTGGPGLIFVTYAELFTIVDHGYIWAVFFFTMIVILGLSSQLPLIEMCCCAISDYFPWFNRSRLHNLGLRFAFVMICMALGTIFYPGNGYYWYYFIDERVAGIPLMLVGAIELLAASWLYSGIKSNLILKHVKEMVADNWGSTINAVFYYTGFYWLFNWHFLAPAALIAIFVYDIVMTEPLILFDYVFPEWAQLIAWIMVAISPILIVIFAVYQGTYTYGAACGRCDGWVKTVQPLESWKPAYDELEEDDSNETSDTPSTNPASSDAIPTTSGAPYYAMQISHDPLIPNGNPPTNPAWTVEVKRSPPPAYDIEAF